MDKIILEEESFLSTGRVIVFSFLLLIVLLFGI
jgi:hypothetical protein